MAKVRIELIDDFMSVDKKLRSATSATINLDDAEDVFEQLASVVNNIKFDGTRSSEKVDIYKDTKPEIQSLYPDSDIYANDPEVAEDTEEKEHDFGIEDSEEIKETEEIEEKDEVQDFEFELDKDFDYR